jgi:hypothetical protein
MPKDAMTDQQALLVSLERAEALAAEWRTAADGYRIDAEVQRTRAERAEATCKRAMRQLRATRRALAELFRPPHLTTHF